MPILNSLLFGTDTSDASATSADVLSGKTAYVDDEKITGTIPRQVITKTTLSAGESVSVAKGYYGQEQAITANSLASQTPGTAIPSEIASGETAWVNGNKVTGTMAKNAATTTSLSAGDSYTIPQGYHDGAGKVTANSLASQTSATAVGSDILQGETAWVNGNKVTGTIPNITAEIQALDAGDSYTIPQGYHDGAGTVTANSIASQTVGTAKAENIEEGKTAYVNGVKITGMLISAKPEIIDITESTTPSSESYDACYGNGKYVAVATNEIIYSTDGITWIAATSLSSALWSSVCYGGGKFVTVARGSNIAAYSEDGITWTQTTLPSSQLWDSVCYGNGRYVAISSNTFDSNIAVYSTDGITWAQATMPSLSVVGNWKSVCYGNGKFVAVSTGSDGSDEAVYSPDGITWTKTELPYFAMWVSACYGNGKFVAIAGARKDLVAYSVDGITWTKSNYLPRTMYWNAVCYGNGMFIAINTGDAEGADTNVAAYSTDGITWIETILSSTASWGSICYGNKKFVLLTGFNSNKVAVLSTRTPPNYTNWGTARASDVREGVTFTSEEGFTIDGTSTDIIPPPIVVQSAKPGIKNVATATLSTFANWKDICYGNGKFVAVASQQSSGSGSSHVSYGTAYSVDGVTWTYLDVDDVDAGITISKAISVTYGNGKFIAIDATGRFSYSTDGINWASITPIIQNYTSLSDYKKIFYCNGKFFMSVGQAEDSGGVIDPKVFVSEDGETWSDSSIPVVLASPSLLSICYGNGRFVCTITDSRNSTGYYSLDGKLWNKSDAISSTNSSVNWKVEYGNGKFIAIANSTTGGKLADASIQYSIDGVNWTDVSPDNVSKTSICYSNGVFVISPGADSKYFKYSTNGIDWTTFDSYQLSSSVDSMCYGNGKFLAWTQGNANNYGVITTEMPPSDVDWGNAKPSDVLQGVTFTSSEGYTLEGTYEPSTVPTTPLDPVEVYNNTRPADWLQMPVPNDNEIYLLVHIPDGASSLLAFTLSMEYDSGSSTGGSSGSSRYSENYNIQFGSMVDGAFVPTKTEHGLDSDVFETEILADDYSDLTSTGMKQCMIRIYTDNYQYKILTWEPATHSKKTNSSNFINYNIVEIACRATSATKIACSIAVPNDSGGNSIYGLINLQYFTWYGTNKVTSMYYNFGSCCSLVAVPQLDTSSVTQMMGMFAWNNALKAIPRLDTSKATNMTSMFRNCFSLTAVPQLNTSNVTNTSSMFINCRSLENIPQLDTSKVTNMYRMFYQCYRIITIPQLDTSKVTNMAEMFYSCTSLVKMPQLNTAEATSMQNMFYNCNSLKTIPFLITSNVTNMSGMFMYCNAIQEIPNLDTSKVTNMNNMFKSCLSINTIPLLDTSKVTDMSYMFYDSGVNTIPRLNTSSAVTTTYMFTGSDKLAIVPELDMSNVTDMSHMFEGCQSLTTISKLKIVKVTKATNAFTSCYALASIKFDPSVTPQEDYADIDLNHCCLSHDALVTLFNSAPSTTAGNHTTTGKEPFLLVEDNYGYAEITTAEHNILYNKGWRTSSTSGDQPE